MVTTREIGKALTQVAIAKKLGVGNTAVSKEVIKGSFPPSWYFVIKDMCDEIGMTCPISLFKFKTSCRISAKQLGGESTKGQDPQVQNSADSASLAAS